MFITSFFMNAAFIHVMVIDTGYKPHPSITHKVNYSTSTGEHGTIVTGALLNGLNKEDKLCSRVVVSHCGNSGTFSPDELISCLDEAVNTNVKYINISMNGSDRKTKDEYLAFKRAQEAGIRVIMAAGNQRLDLSKRLIYPHGYSLLLNNMTVVSAPDVPTANRGWWTVNNVKGTYLLDERTGVKKGTSFSAPLFLNKLLQKECLK